MQSTTHSHFVTLEIQHPSLTTTPMKLKAPKRGKRSAIPLEQREQIRRLKKQNMERRRRACISDKMNALYNLAMSLIGEDPMQYQKTEKADILNMCYSVFENVASVVNEQPDVRLRVQKLSDHLRNKLSSSPIRDGQPRLSPESVESKWFTEEEEEEEEKENKPSHLPSSNMIQNLQPTQFARHSTNHIPIRQGMDYSVPVTKISKQPFALPASPYPLIALNEEPNKNPFRTSLAHSDIQFAQKIPTQTLGHLPLRHRLTSSVNKLPHEAQCPSIRSSMSNQPVDLTTSVSSAHCSVSNIIKSPVRTNIQVRNNVVLSKPAVWRPYLD